MICNDHVMEVKILNVTVNGKKMQINPSFTEHAQQRLDAKLDKFFGDEAEAKVMLTERKGNIELELTVRYNQMLFRAEQTAVDKSDALDAAIDKIIRQIRKNKTRLEKRVKAGGIEAITAELPPQIAEEPEEEYEVVRKKQIHVKPISVDEAILEMNMINHDFFMFINAETDKVNVVYKREGGNYGLLELARD